ncbi:hypothetical protein ACQCN2_21150 [Brevibacillus ginsengisoli]|uniref:hypothetical protein n=1 Tax=Brevibacillus ginsengisoli TaxID=363854 RepID=UPI003CFA7DAD
MLVKGAEELVERCYEDVSQLLSLSELKEVFIKYVFEDYQDLAVAELGLDGFYDHLEDIQLVNCRKDFDHVVEEWYLKHFQDSGAKEYDDFLFQLAKEAIATFRSQTREELVEDLSCLLTSSNGFMSRWKVANEQTTSMYFRYLHRLGIRSYQDIQLFVETWLMEYPEAFNQETQQLFQREARRGRPNNPGLYKLLERIQELKPNLTKKEKERIRKIYYYHRKSLTTQAMVEKFKQYMRLKASVENNSIS